MQTVTMEKGFLLNLDDARKTALREKIANKEISLDIIETPQNAEVPKAQNPIAAEPQKQNAINFTLNKEATPLSHTQYGELLKEDVEATMPSMSFGEMGTPDKSKPKFKAAKDEDGDAQTYPESAKVADEIEKGVYKLETTPRPDVDGVTKWKRGLLAKTDDLKTNVANAKRVFEQGGYNLVGVKANEDGFATQSNVYKLEKDGNEYIIDESSINSSFWDMGGDPASSAIALGTVGIGKAIGLGAIGNMIDQAISKVVTGEELTPKQRAIEVAKEAALFGAGETVVKGIGKVVDEIGDVTKLPQKAWDYATNNNIDGAVDKLKKDLQVDEAVLDASVENAKKDIKEVEQYSKEGLISDVDKKQEQIINTLLQDKEGLGANIIKDAIKSDTKAATNLTHTIKNRADKVKSFFSDDQLRGRELVADMDEYIKRKGTEFGDMKRTFNEAFKHTGYTFDAESLGLMQNMQKDIKNIIDPYSKQTAENLLSSTAESIENATNGGKILDINTLLDVRASVNHFYRLAKKTLDYHGVKLYKDIIGGIDEQVLTSIEKNLPEEMQGKMQSLFKNTMKEYADMKSFSDSPLYKEVVEKKGVSEEERVLALVKNIANDDGQFTFLMQNLPPQRQAAVENGVLSSMLKEHTHDVGGIKGAVDYASFFDDASKMSDFFTTPQAKETVSLLQEMNEKYSRDFEILGSAAKAASSTNTGAGIATTWWGRVEYLIAKSGFDKLMRLMPTEAGRSKALREHVRQALHKSRTPIDFIKRSITAPDLPQSDKTALKEMIASNNALQRAKNEQEAQKIAMEIEAKEAARVAAEAEAKTMLDNFDSVDGAELLAVQKLGGYDALAQTVKNLQNPATRTVDDVKKFMDAKAKIDPKRLEEQTIKIKYPLKDADAKIEKLLESNALDGVMDETTLKVLRYDIKQGKLRNEAIEQKYKEAMKLYDEVSSIKPPEVLLREKEVLLNESLRKMKFEESVDDAAAAAVHRENAAKLQSEIEELRAQIPTRSTPQLSSQAQRVKDTADMNYHDSEDEAAQAVKDLFKKNTSEEKRFANMSDEDMVEYERIHGSDTAPKQKSNEILYDDDGEIIPFANPHIGAGVVAGSGNALEYDEEGNLAGFDTEKFVTGFLAGTIGSKVGAVALKKHNAKLYNKIVGVSKEFPNMATANPKLLAEIYKTAPTTKGQALMFAGEKAIKADIGKLDDAIKLMDDGTSEADIWKTTGWFKGDDGKWRFEIDDSGAKVKPFQKDKISHRLDEVLDHPKLFDQYPELRNIWVSKRKKTGGSFFDNHIKADTEEIITDISKQEDEIYKKVEELEKQGKLTPQIEVQFEKQLNELDKQSRQGLAPKKSTLLHEVQHAIQEIENFARGGSPNNFSKHIPQEQLKEIYAVQGILEDAIKRKNSDEWVYNSSSLEEIIKSDLDIPSNIKQWAINIAKAGDKEVGDFLAQTPFNQYQRLHGEAEARLTQKRAIDGYEKFPYDDLDVPRDVLIKKFDSGEAEMAKELENRYIKNDKVLESELMKDALELPKPIKTYKEFTNMLSKKDNEYFIKTPVGDISLDARYTFSHFTDNTHFDDRGYISGAFLETLADPLFVVAKKHKGKENLVFYKPFKDEKGKYHLASFTIDDEHKTFFELDNLGKVKGLIKSSEKDMRYFKHSQAYNMLDTEQVSLSKSVYDKSISKDYKDSQGFYSVLEKTIDEKVGGKIDSNSLKSMLEKNGVKQDEIEWSGLKELMESKEKLTREEIEETIKSNRLEIEVVGKGTLVKYKKYKLDGGENYRELLFRKPAKTPEGVKFIKADDGYWYAEKAPYDGTNVVSSAKNKAALEKEFNVKEFKHSHWDEGNILVFTRVDDRTIDGKDTLFIEELQSDWHQGGRKEGYGKKIPNAPFKKNWHELGLKRMVQEAVANDYDKIAWTTGKQQAERYSLEKTVDTVVYNKDSGVIQATNGSKEVFFKRVSSEKEIEDIMGKELTARLLDKKNTTTDSVHVLQGEELKFGGEGMQAFYDEIVPNSVKKLFKKWGVKPKMEELDDVEQMVWSVDITPQMKDDIKKYGQPLYALPIMGAVGATQGEDK